MRQFNEGVKLRYIEECDAEQIAKWLSTPNGSGTSRALAAHKLKSAEHWRDAARSKYKKMIHLVLRPDGSAIGISFFHNIDVKSKSLHLGLAVLDATARGKGYGFSAKLLQLHTVFDELKMETVVERLSATEVKLADYMVRELGCRRRGSVGDMIELEIDRASWEESKARRRASKH
ncbi:GNAT family N-acetyltransferase [Bradyrhizobium shewense]|uniref:GNAT family N-acetyltransferase n=1 Tax=Bradyrhizobium shewense TaxID=1761772 RepID=UPI0013F5A0FE|nr:GNAT family N-acetyltransferase [Bradyrhizobium shewense]